MNIYLIYLIILAVGIFSGRLLTRLDARKMARLAPRITIYLILLFFTVYSCLSCWRYYNLIYGYYDFGTFDDMLRNMAYFKSFFRNSDGVYDEHFNLLLLIYVPLYWIWDSPYMLLIAQAMVMSAAAYPLFLLGKKIFRHNLPALIPVFMYLFNPYFSRYVLYEFHAGALFPILFFSAFLALESGKRKTFLLLMFIIPMAKESFVIVMFGAGLFLLTKKRYRKEGAACLLFSLFWTWFILNVWFPHIIPLQYHHSDRYPPVFGDGIFSTIANCWAIFMRAVTWNGLAVFISFLLAFALLPLFSPSALILMCGPVMLSQLCSRFFHQQFIMSHYSDGCNIVFPLAALYGLYNLRHLTRSAGFSWKKYFPYCFTLPLVTHVFLCDLIVVKYHNYIESFKADRQFGILSLPFNPKFLKYKHPALFHEIRKIIPPGYSIVTQNNLLCPFLRTNKCHQVTWPHPVDFYLFDSVSYDKYNSEENIMKRYNYAKNSPEYVCIVARDGYFLFCRKALLAKMKESKK